jgi:hypothetical protein
MLCQMVIYQAWGLQMKKAINWVFAVSSLLSLQVYVMTVFKSDIDLPFCLLLMLTLYSYERLGR